MCQSFRFSPERLVFFVLFSLSHSLKISRYSWRGEPEIFHGSVGAESDFIGSMYAKKES